MLGIILAVAIGVFGGLFFRIDFVLNNLNFFVDLGLCLLLFFVGIDIGKKW